MRILDRYILREVGQTWFAVTGVLLIILVGNQFARILGDAAAGELPRNAVASLLGLTSLNYLTILVPVGLFLSIMLAMGRLYKDSEMAAIVACGVGPGMLYRPLAIFAVVVASLLAFLSLEGAPWAMRQIHALKEVAQQEAEVGSIAAGRFRSTGFGVVFYAQSATADGRLKDVFLEHRKGDVVEVVVAEYAEQLTDPERNLRLMVLYDGVRFEGVPGEPRFRTTEFKEHGIPIQLDEASSPFDKVEAQPVSMLLASDSLEARSELQWRLSAPVSALMLVLLALPLSRTTPRRGRYGKLAIAVLIYILYSNLLGAARVWLEQERIPSILGLWWVHVLVFGLAMLLLHRNFGAASVNTGRRVKDSDEAA
ncbi:MAG: LPS export ABC transporter permease LptF [Gammaproteobacteria bacterium]